jgi:hypothetical protein
LQYVWFVGGDSIYAFLGELLSFQSLCLWSNYDFQAVFVGFLDIGGVDKPV